MYMYSVLFWFQLDVPSRVKTPTHVKETFLKQSTYVWTVRSGGESICHFLQNTWTVCDEGHWIIISFCVVIHATCIVIPNQCQWEKVLGQCMAHQHNHHWPHPLINMFTTCYSCPTKMHNTDQCLATNLTAAHSVAHCYYYCKMTYTLSIKRNLSLLQTDIHWNPLHQNDSYLDTD